MQPAHVWPAASHSFLIMKQFFCLSCFISSEALESVLLVWTGCLSSPDIAVFSICCLCKSLDCNCLIEMLIESELVEDVPDSK